MAAGRDEIRRLLAGLFEREVSYSWDVTETPGRRPAGQLELVMAEAIGHSRGVGENEDFAYRLSGVLSREEDGWRWLQLHGAEPTVPGIERQSSAGVARNGPRCLAYLFAQV